MDKSYFTGRVFLVTGAGSGIGFETARVLLENGAFVHAFVRKSPALEALQKQYKNSLSIFKGDVAKPKDCEKYVRGAAKKYKKINALVHCAGVGIRSAARDIQNDVFRNVMEVNFNAMVYLLGFCRKYIEKENGHVVAVSSVQGMVALPYRSVYGAAKHALNAYIRSVRLEEKNIHYLCVNFGYVKTDFSVNALTGEGDRYSRVSAGQLKGLDVAEAVRMMLEAIVKRKKEITPAGFKEKFALFVYRLFPALYDILIVRFVKPD